MKTRPIFASTAAVVLAVSFWASGVRPGRCAPPRSSVSQPQGTRDRLTASDLLAGRFPEVVHNDYFMAVGESGAAEHSFSGVIHLSETQMNTTRPDRDWSGSGQSYFPELSLRVVRHGDYLIPLDRGIIYSGGRGRSFWSFIASPGRVWHEPGDNGWSRASVPFVFIDNFIGQALNGLATFLFTSGGVSWVAVQITQETSPEYDFSHGDYNAAVAARFEPRDFADAVRAAEEYERELAARPPVESWSVLPLAGFTSSFFNSDIPPESVSSAGLLLDGTLYLQPAETRSGPFPYPQEMRHGVFSVTKTMLMGLSMFYFAERYGEGLFDELITDYVPELAAHPGWRGVTFGNALDMATGTQGTDRDLNFIMARSAADKLSAVRDMPDAAPAPGETFSYASSHTFTLSCALSRYVKTKEGPDADYWLLVRDNVLRPIGAGALPVLRTFEPDGALGTPVGGWGCYPTAVEAVQIGRLMSNEGIHNGRQILNKSKVREALERTSRRGLPTHLAATRYLRSLWIYDVTLSTGLVAAPHMKGHGGNIVFVLPGAVVAVRFADEDNFDMAPMVAVAEVYRRSELPTPDRPDKDKPRGAKK